MDDAVQPHEAGTTPLPHRRRRRVPTWALAAGAFALGVCVGLVVSWLMSPKIVAQLRPTTEAVIPIPMEGVAFDPATVVQYEDTDLARVWSAQSHEGLECLFAIVGGEEWGYACAPGELDPTVDFTIDDGSRYTSEMLDVPSGSLVRVVLRDDVVEVWIAATAEVD